MGDSGQLGNQEEPHDLNRKGLLSQGSNSTAMKSRVNREVQARFCERLEVKPLRPTRPLFFLIPEAERRLIPTTMPEWLVSRDSTRLPSRLIRWPKPSATNFHSSIHHRSLRG